MKACLQPKVQHQASPASSPIAHQLQHRALAAIVIGTLCQGVGLCIAKGPGNWTSVMQLLMAATGALTSTKTCMNTDGATTMTSQKASDSGAQHTFCSDQGMLFIGGGRKQMCNTDMSI